MLWWRGTILREKSCNLLEEHMFNLQLINKHGSSLEFSNVRQFEEEACSRNMASLGEKITSYSFLILHIFFWNSKTPN